MIAKNLTQWLAGLGHAIITIDGVPGPRYASGHRVAQLILSHYTDALTPFEWEEA